MHLTLGFLKGHSRGGEREGEGQELGICKKALLQHYYPICEMQ